MEEDHIDMQDIARGYIDGGLAGSIAGAATSLEYVLAGTIAGAAAGAAAGGALKLGLEAYSRFRDDRRKVFRLPGENGLSYLREHVEVEDCTGEVIPHGGEKDMDFGDLEKVDRALSGTFYTVEAYRNGEGVELRFGADYIADSGNVNVAGIDLEPGQELWVDVEGHVDESWDETVERLEDYHQPPTAP
ncbi:MAG: hypothetical protein ABEJ64_03070 [Candidatus Nanohaloarchaea archaeon]